MRLRKITAAVFLAVAVSALSGISRASAPATCSITGTLFDLYGNAASNQRVVFDTTNVGVQNVNNSALHVVTPSKQSVTTDAMGNLPSGAGCQPTSGAAVCLVQGETVDITIGLSQPGQTTTAVGPIRVQIPLASSADITTLILANTDPPSLVSSIAIGAGGDFSMSVVNPANGSVGTSTITPGTVTGLNGIALCVTAPTSGQVLGYNGTTWCPTTLGATTKIPPMVTYLGTGAEGAETVTGVTSLSGTHDFTSLTISGVGQINIGNFGYLVMRVTGACSIASLATCTKFDGSTDSACAIDLTGVTNSLTGQGTFGGSGGGGGGAAATNAGAAGSRVLSTAYELLTFTGGSGGANNGSNGSNGTAVSQTIAESFLDLYPDTTETTFATAASATFGGATGGAGGNGNGTGGTAGKGGSALLLTCGSFTTMTGHIVADGQKGGIGTANQAGGGGGGGGGYVVVNGPGGYTGANISVAGGNGNTTGGGGTGGTGGNGGKGTGWNCDSTANTCTQL